MEDLLELKWLKILLIEEYEVTIIEMANQIMAPIDFEMASILHTHLKEKGVS